MKRSARHAAVGIAVGLCCSAPWAQAAPDAAAAATAVTQLRDVFQYITTAINTFAAGNAELITLGKRTAVTLFGVLLVWGLLKSWILGKGVAQLLPEFIQPLVIFGLTLWSIDHLGPTVKSSVESLGQIFSSTLFQSGGPPNESDILDRMAAASFEIVTASPSESASWINVPSLIAHEAVGFLYRLVAAVVLMVAGVIAAGVMMMAKVQTALAVLFAPVMIPWAMWQPSAFLFNAWLSFLIGGAMQGVMALAVASLSAQMVDKVVDVARSMGVNDGMSFVTCCVLLLMALLIAFLFLKVPSLASGLVGGAAIQMEGWRAVTHGTGQGGSTLAQATTSSGRAAYQFGKGAWQGFGRGSDAGPSSAVLSATPPPAPRSALHVPSAAAPTGPTGPQPAYPVAPAPMASDEGAAPKALHKPFRPKPGIRPVNRPVDRSA